MATSQNGWSAYESSTGLVSFPWVTGRVRPGDVYTVLNYLARRFNAEVEGIEAWQSWGWNYRAVRGSTTGLSNHASGTAVDFNATRHGLGRRGTFNARQVAAIRRILADLGGVVRWGGDYTARADEMHFEINAAPARVAAVARAIGAGTVSNPVGGGGSVTIPNVGGGIPAAPAKETFLMALTDAEQKNLLNLVQNLAGWVYLGGAGVNAGTAASGTIAQRVINLDRNVTGAQGNNVNLVDAIGELLARTAPVNRGESVSIRQEIADTKSMLIAALPQIVALASRQGDSRPVSVDVPALAAALKDSLGSTIVDELINRLKD